MLFDKQPELDTYYERRHPACEHGTSDSWRSTTKKTSPTEKRSIIEKNDCRVSVNTEEMTYAVWSLTNWVYLIR